MKVIGVKSIKSAEPVKVIDCFVDGGYLQGESGSLPDVDIDYASDRRQEVKEYIRQRYNHGTKQRVFSAGTFTTMKLKAVIKDVARTMRISPSLVNYLTAIFDKECDSYTSLFKAAHTNKKIAKFIQDYPMLFEDIRTLMNQPRSSSVNASALLITPETKDGKDMECFDYTPIKKIDGALVSEFDGYTLDEQGLLKNDCLATIELSKLKATMDICNKVYGTDLSLEKIAIGSLDDKKTFEILSEGFTQNVFQLASKGMTRFIKDLQPKCIDDLIAANALFRPATLENGSTDNYVNCKNGLIEPVYLWGTYNALKDTYGLIVYQEQVAMLVREVGGFSLGEGVKLVKFVSKKKMDKIKALKDKFMDGAKKKGCPDDDAKAIWEQIETCGSYIFNRSHSTAYAVTSYAGAYLKANYPTAFYTVALQYANDDELPILMGEMTECSKAKVVPPDINVSETTFFTDYETDSIFWSLTRIKMVGVKPAEWIIAERAKRGKFTSIENFIERIFRYKLKVYKYWDDPDSEEEVTRCPVNARHVLNLILAGCFDKVENALSSVERYAIILKAAECLGFKVNEKDIPEDMRGKHYFWSQQQLKISGIGAIDYKRAYDNSDAKILLKKKVSYVPLKDILDEKYDGKRVVICATIVEVIEKSFNSKKTGREEIFCRLMVQQGNEINEVVLWPEDYADHKDKLVTSLNKLAVISANVKYNDYATKNTLQAYKNSIIEIL